MHTRSIQCKNDIGNRGVNFLNDREIYAQEAEYVNIVQRIAALK